jgi:hypothetical protein
MNTTPVPKIPVCYKAGIASYPCNSLPQLRLADGPGKGNWLCDEHYFQVRLNPPRILNKITDLVLNYRPEAKQKPPRQRKKSIQKVKAK